MGWVKRFFAPSPVHGEAGERRGYVHTLEYFATHSVTDEGSHWWCNADPSRDDYDRGVLRALRELGVTDPSEPTS